MWAFNSLLNDLLFWFHFHLSVSLGMIFAADIHFVNLIFHVLDELDHVNA